MRKENIIIIISRDQKYEKEIKYEWVYFGVNGIH